MFIIIIFWILASLINGSSLNYPDLTISMGPTITNDQEISNQMFIAYQNKSTTKGFYLEKNSQFCCTPPDQTVFSGQNNLATSDAAQENTVLMTIINSSKNMTYSLVGYLVTQYFQQNNIQTDIVIPSNANIYNIQPGVATTLDIVHHCSARIDNYNYWNLLQITLIFNDETVEPVNIYYQFLCSKSYYPKRFDIGYIILLPLFSFFVILGARFGKIKSIIFYVKNRNPNQNSEEQIFQGFYVNVYYAIPYLVLIALSIFVQFQQRQNASKGIFGILGVCLVLAAHQINELLCSVTICGFHKKVIFRSFRVCDLFSILIALSILVPYMAFNKPWFVSDMLTILILNSLLKIFKLTSLKDAVMFFIPCLLIDGLSSLILVLSFGRNWDVWVLIDSNNPFVAEMQLIHFLYQRKCAWISVYSLLLPGIFVGYSTRYGINKQTRVYLIICSIGLVTGLLLWFVTVTNLSFPIPMSLFTVIPMMGFCSLFAYKRGDFYTYWNGFFYDEILLDPFKNVRQLQAEATQVTKSKISPVEGEISLPNMKTVDLSSSQLVQARPSGTYQIDPTIFAGIVVSSSDSKGDNDQNEQ